MTAFLVFALSYVALAVGRIPGLRSDRVAAVIVGGSLMVALRVLSFDEAQRVVDGATLALLFGMMVLSAALDVSGAFALSGWGIIRSARTPFTLLVVVSLAAAVASALMMNDVVCLAFTPLVLEICETLACDPKPYLLALATSSNIGSVATITGNPQNILIASLSHIGYRHFAARLVPVSVCALLVNVAVLALVHRRALSTPFPHREATAAPSVRVAGVRKGAIVTVAVLVAFVAGAPPAIAAMLGGSAMLLTRATDPRKIYAEVDWTLLALFTGLFVIVGGIEHAGVAEHLLAFFTAFRSDTVWGLTALTAVLSNIVSNVPAVMVLKSSVPQLLPLAAGLLPLAAGLPHAESAWLTLAMASTFAGNLTLPGSLATIIVVERARGRSEITFLDFLAVGLPSAILSLIIGALWLSFS